MSLQLATLCLQILTILVALIASFRGRKYMFGFAITFSIYTYFDLAHMYGWQSTFLTPTTEAIILFIAAISATYSIWKVYQSR